MLGDAQVRGLLAPFEIELTSVQVSQVFTYLELLLRWNEKINLTSVRNESECVTRHFGESLFLASFARLRGNLMDVGSGAGFPGLALKVAFPELEVVLLEPVAKKRAFLKEVVRACGMERVSVRGERLEDFIQGISPPSFSNVTWRAVGQTERLLPLAAACLKPAGRISLWVSRDDRKDILKMGAPIEWEMPHPVPLSNQREILVGVRG